MINYTNFTINTHNTDVMFVLCISSVRPNIYCYLISTLSRKSGDKGCHATRPLPLEQIPKVTKTEGFGWSYWATRSNSTHPFRPILVKQGHTLSPMTTILRHLSTFMHEFPFLLNWVSRSVYVLSHRFPKTSLKGCYGLRYHRIIVIPS